MDCIRRKVVGVHCIALAVLLLPSTAWAQTSAIAGAVRDATGRPVANVKVEASSPALIEKIRSVTTDGSGQYRIIDLPIGQYEVTFTAAGMSTVKNVAIDLPAQFTATVNASMKAGNPSEVVTMTGASSTVDTTSATQVTNTTSDTFENAPTGSKQVTAVGATVAGLTGSADSSGEGGASSNIGSSFHGKTGGNNKTQFDGYRIQNQQALGNTLYIVNTDAVNSVALETGGTTAESIASGFAANMVPKSGSNKFAGQISGMFANKDLQSDNVSDELRARGLTQSGSLEKQWDIGGTLGGPIKKDKIWFFTAHRKFGNENVMPGPLYFNLQQGSPFYVPDLSRQWFNYKTVLTDAVRITWNPTPRNKLRFFLDWQDVPTPGSNTQFQAPEASTSAWRFKPQSLYQATWSMPVTKKLLLEAGFGTSINHWTRCLPKTRGSGCSDDIPTAISFLDLTNNFQYGSFGPTDLKTSPGLGLIHTGDRYSQRFIASYTTSTHNVRVGLQWEEGIKDSDQIVNESVQYVVRAAAGQNPSTTGITNIVPESITEFAMPFFVKMRIKADLGLFVQDQWTRKRFSVNYGLRYDNFTAYVPEQSLGAGRFVPERNFGKVDRIPAFHDLSPRVGLAYDVFGNAKTAVKLALGKYVGPADLSITELNNPIVTSISSTTRAWRDTNANYQPDCDLTNRGEQDFTASGGDFCGALQNQNFGTLNTNALSFADSAIHGYGQRDYNWDISAEVQHEVNKNTSLSVGYYWSVYYNFVATDNVALQPSDFQTFCITSPNDPRLGADAAKQVCGLYDVNPLLFGQQTDVVKKSKAINSDNQGQRRNDFFNVSGSTRLKNGIRASGGLDWGRIVKDDCFAKNLPQLQTQLDLNSARTANAHRVYCHEVTPWMANLQFKANVNVPLPYGIAFSGIYQNVAGPVILANWPAPTAVVLAQPVSQGGLGRNLAGGTRSVTVPLIEPGTQYEDRRNQFDIRGSKTFRVSQKARLQANVDLYNLFNWNYVLTRNNTFGSSWGRPQSILSGRLVQFSGKLSF